MLNIDSTNKKILYGLSPLRYPGGKTRALKEILAKVPEYEEYREPMVGGGSVFFALKTLNPQKKYWINDINKELYLFWKYCKEEPKGLISKVRRMKRIYKGGKTGGKRLYRNLIKLNPNQMTELERAARFFILNRISYSGLIESGGYSKEAYRKRFTKSSIKRIYKASKLLEGVRVTNLDYSELMTEPSKEKVFLFIDPPYVSKSYAKLYGKHGRLHTGFDHQLFAEDVKKCKYTLLVTYDKCNTVDELYKFANLIGWELQYGTNNSAEERKNKSARIGNEVFISKNYEIPKTYILNEIVSGV